MHRSIMLAVVAVVAWASSMGLDRGIAVPVVRAGSWRVEQTINGKTVPAHAFCLRAEPVVRPPDDYRCAPETVARQEDGALVIKRTCAADGGKRTAEQHAVFRGDPNRRFTVDGRVTMRERGRLLPLVLDGHSSYRYLGVCAR
ncbi:MAG TPA: DUF3617 family protein [Caulobacteraceae bacterium]